MGKKFALSDVQRAYYLGRRKEFELGGTSTHICYQFNTNLEPVRLEKALNMVIKRQEMMQARIVDENTQEILDQVPCYRIPVLDLSNKEESEQEKFLIKERTALFTKSQDPGIWPQYDFLYVRMGKGRNVLLLSFDMLVADSSSLILLGRELKHYYEQPDIALEPLTGSYETYIKKQAEQKTSARYEKDRSYWLSRLEDLPAAPSLPAGKKDEIGKKDFEPISRITLRLEKEIWQSLKQCAKENDVSPTSLVLAAYIIVLGHWSENKDFTINLTMSERGKYKENSLVGDYTTALLVGVNQETYRKKCLMETAKKISKEMLLSYRHNSFNGLEVMREFSGQRNLGTKAVMPIVFTSMLFKEDTFEILDFFGEMEYGISQTPQVILDCQATEYHGDLFVTWDYAVGYVDKQSLEEMGQQMLGILSCNPFEVSEEVFALSEEENELWNQYNRTSADFSGSTLLELVYEGVCRNPDKIAVKGKNEEISYRDLWLLSDQVKRELSEQGIRPGEYVCISARRDISTILNILGVLKCHGGYVPILEEYPDERADYIRRKSESRFFLKPFKWEILIKKNESNELLLEPALKDDAGRPAYVIFTSGSTGKPKGVVISNQAAVNTIRSVNQRFCVTSEDVFLGISSLCFDLSVYDLFGAFSNGATLILVQNQKDSRELVRLCREEKVTIWNSVPALCELLLGELEESYENTDIRSFLLSGDWISLNLPGRLKKHFKNAGVISLGGATEASIWSIFYRIGEVNGNWSSIPYGSPLDNQKIYVLDEEGRLCPPEVIGEICIGGTGVAEEYLNDAEKTNAAFRVHESFGRIYHTGDFGRFRRMDRQIEFVGRRDSQIKVNGYRIETGEIEAALLQIAQIREASVLAEGERFKKVTAFYSLSEMMKPEQVYQELEKILPAYMIPSRLIEVPAMPLTGNGKVDRKKLLEFGQQQQKSRKPQNEMEEMILRLWEEVLGIEGIGMNQNFFSLGGDSIKAIQIISALKRKGCQVEMKELYTHATIELLASIVKAEKTKAEYVPVEGTYELTPSQKWFFRKIRHGRNQWNQYISLELNQPLNDKNVKKSLELLVTYHDILRTSFTINVPVIQNNTGGIEDLNHYFAFRKKHIETEAEIEAENKLLQQSFDLENGPLFGAAYYEGNKINRLYFFIHHLLTDGISLRLLLQDFQEIYEAVNSQKEVGNYQPAFSYMEWSAFLLNRSIRNREEISVYWTTLIEKGLKANRRWLVRDLSAAKDYRSNGMIMEKSALTKMNREEALLGAFLTAFSKAEQADSLMLEIEYHGRDEGWGETDIQNTSGWFSYTYPVVLEGLQHKNTEQMAELVQNTLSLIPDKGRDVLLLQAAEEIPDYPVLIHFNYLGTIDTGNYGSLAKHVTAGQIVSPDSEGIAALTVVPSIEGNSIRWSITYDPNIFSDQWVQDLLDEIAKPRQEEQEDLSRILEQLFA